MDHKIIRPKDIIIDNILIKKKTSVGQKIYNLPIKYINDSLIIQTPILNMPFGKYSYGKKSYIDVSFINDVVDKEMCMFKETIQKINKLVINNISKKNKKIKFVDSIKKSNEIYADRLRLNIQEDILIFNEKKELINQEYLKAKSYVKFLICPNNIWLNEEKYGITWVILQAKVYPQTILNTYCFLDDKEDIPTKSEKYSSHPLYKKYFKMVSCGVPKEAVKHKMVLDNLDPNVLDNKKPIILQNNLVNPILNDIDDNDINIKNKLNNSISNILAMKNSQTTKINMMAQIKLSKQQKERKKEIILKDVKEVIGYKPPSLMDIIEMRKNLKSNN